LRGLRSRPYILFGPALGLYASRVFLETLPRTLPFLVSLLLTGILVALGMLVAAVGRRRGLRLLPLLVLCLYVIWPRMWPLLAFSVAFVAVVALWHSNAHRSYWLPAGAVLLVVSVGLYVRTLAPTILPADSGEFQFVSHVLGIAHPPGYPLYTLLAKLFTYLPVRDIAYRVNLFSALTSATTLVVLGTVVHEVTGSVLAGGIAAAALGVAPTFWAQSTTANIRSLTALFTVLQLGALVGYAESKDRKSLVIFSAALGLGITHHSSLLPLALPYVVFLLLTDPQLVRRPRSWVRPLAAFVASLAVLLYLPLRSWMGAPFDPQPIRSLAGFVEHVLALGFRGDMFYFVQPSILLSRVRVLLNILTFEFGTLWLLLTVWGAAALWLRRRRLLLLLGGVFAVNALLAVTYRAPQTVEYLMPAYVALTCVSAYGAWSLSASLPSSETWARALAAVILAVVLAVPVARLVREYPSFAQLSQDHSARLYAENVLTQAPQGARILSNWHFVTPMWYLQYVEQMRPDVDVVYVYPEGAEPIAETWKRRIEESVTSGPTIVTNQYPEFGSLPYSFQPYAGAWLVQLGPVFQVPTGIQNLGAQFDDRIELAGFELESDTVSPSDSCRVQLYWRPAVKLERAYSFFVHLVDERGVPLGQGDVTHPAERYEVGQVILDEYDIPLLPTVKPGRYRLIAGVYITLEEGGWQRLTTKDGQDAVMLGFVQVQPLRVAPVTQHEELCPFDGGYTLVGADYDHSLPGQLRLYLHWRTDNSITQPQRAVVFSSDMVLAEVQLPAMPVGKYFTTAHDLPVDAKDLALEVQSLANGEAAPWLGPWKLPFGRRLALPTPNPDERYVSLGGEMVLIKAEYPATSDRFTSLPTWLTFVGTRALTRDYTVSATLRGEAGTWQTQHDGTPALGAIPTLKWIRGITVRDEHDLPLPADAAGRGVLRLTVYNAFTLQPLPVLDERFARLGQGTQLELGIVEVREP
jgi:hypothetical protein